MCGIIGYVGGNRKIEFVLNKLKMLEYRGYDSSGIIDFKNNKFSCTKAISNINELIKKVDLNKKITCAMAHTRWSTHGKPTLENAHPHVSSKSTWAVVHNGIIENDEDIRKELKSPLISDTDSAVIPELLEEHQANDIYSFIDSIKLLKGSYGILAMNAKKTRLLIFS